MLRKLALIAAAAAVTVPVGTAVMSNTAGAATRTRPAVVVDHQHKEKAEPASKDKSPEGSSKDRVKDAHHSKDTTKDPVSRDPSGTMHSRR